MKIKELCLFIYLLCLISTSALAQSISDLYPSNPFFNGNFGTPQDTWKNSKNALMISRNPFLSKLYNSNSKIKIDERAQHKQYTIDVRPKPNTSLRSSSESSEELTIDDICGTSVVKNLIVNGDDIKRGEYPWLAAMWHKGKNRGISFKCGGSLISHMHVVTAAHCVAEKEDSPEDLVFYIGYTNISWNSYTINPDNGVVEGYKIHIHPKYKQSSEGDIAIVKLKKAVPFSAFIRPLCLWPSKYKTDFNSIINFTGRVAGWGINEEGRPNYERPTFVRIPTVSKEMCLRANSAYLSLVQDDTFCAGAKDGKGPCGGDSGDAFILRQDGRWVLRGIVSTSLRSLTTPYNCDLTKYVVFVDAAQYLDWIKSIMKNEE